MAENDKKIPKCRSWFCVYNNPDGVENIDINDKNALEDFCDSALSKWTETRATRSGAVAICISAQGLKHFHMVFCDSNQCMFAAIKKAFPKAHIEPTMGNKQQAEDYIYKRGKWAEKGEKVLHVSISGDLLGKASVQKDTDAIEQMLAEGMNPNEIMNEAFRYRKYERMIKSAFFAKRRKDVPLKRDINVVWHTGASGTGKTYFLQELVDKYTIKEKNPDGTETIKHDGKDDIYVMTDFKDGGLDHYCAEKVLFMDEYRSQLPYAVLLNMLNGWTVQTHARYDNSWCLWDEVHITSVFPPELCYQKMVSENQDVDTQTQLFRRINTIVYHWKDDTGYHQYSLPMSEYTNIFELKAKAMGQIDDDGFMKVDDYEYTDIEQISLFKEV